MNTAPPLEYVTSFAEASQTMMQQLTTALLTSGESDQSKIGRRAMRVAVLTGSAD